MDTSFAHRSPEQSKPKEGPRKSREFRNSFDKDNAAGRAQMQMAQQMMTRKPGKQKTPPGGNRRISICEQFVNSGLGFQNRLGGGGVDQTSIDSLLEGQRDMNNFMERMFEKLSTLENKVQVMTLDKRRALSSVDMSNLDELESMVNDRPI